MTEADKQTLTLCICGGGEERNHLKLKKMKKQINNRVLLHSTGHYMQYPVMIHNGKEHQKQHMYTIYIYIYIHTHTYI